ncbi:phospholipase D-like domain-containing protein [Rhizobium sp. SSA_523]|uniref:phospholipase D-like domain-containing protein n=1 Tax=Rhizobium sp. SSA_523 TaxID=2952477 RepID=UPI0020917B64|nr:phospholipase D-like domain-containing protein [Rhizobium sp. SSA_523]MCO5731708.1 phospholipase D-like domain-containing protein [Rhizobium sp. SSA_523]WKC22916.1 phospholipase D-like domain-containing protein [Rhizobium sp. SSA_523]
MQDRRTTDKPSHQTIIRPGRNSWRKARADKVAFLIDGAEYYRRLDQVLAKATRSILIVGWDFNPKLRLRPEVPGSPTLGEILRQRVEEEERLSVQILVWGMGPIYSGKSFELFQKGGQKGSWVDHPRIRLEFDFHHPVRGSHHQKMVCVDDSVAFLGGIDLTARRWDDRNHAIKNDLRCSPDGTCYGPVHDIQSIVSGEAARLVGDACRKRWRFVTKSEMPPLQPPEDQEERSETAASLWPDDLAPQLTDCPTALALTEPLRWNGRRGRREAVQLTHDALRAARKHIYIESQYLASFSIARTLIDRLKEKDGPEIVILVVRESHGFLEKVMMGNNRNRLIRRLRRHDDHDRLKVLYAVNQDEDGNEKEIVVHAKLIIIDDRIVRVGSSNLNYRSEGLDTESDLAFEPETDEGRRAIAALRDDLLAEHLDAEPAQIAASMAATGSLLRTIDRYNVKPRGLRSFTIDLLRGETDSVLGTSLVDPRRPFWPWWQLKIGVRWAMSRLTRSFL